jgi:hypothetical protein
MFGLKSFIHKHIGSVLDHASPHNRGAQSSFDVDRESMINWLSLINSIKFFKRISAIVELRRPASGGVG